MKKFYINIFLSVFLFIGTINAQQQVSKNEANLQRKNWYSNATWIQRIKENLNQGRPVYYSGSGSGEHAFVCDGFGSDDYFHFNWGWLGSCDG